MYGYIYKTVDLRTKLIYVGKHKAESFEPEKYIGSGRIISNMLGSNKYSWDDFTCEMIDTADSLEELNQKEKYWIAKFDATNRKIGYNINEGGDGGPDITGFKWFNDGETEYLLSPEEAETTTLKKGRLIDVYKPNDSVWVNNGKVQHQVLPDKLQYYLDRGFVYGMLDRGDEWRNNVAKAFEDNKEQRIATLRESTKKFHEEHPHWTNQTSWKKGQSALNKGKVFVTNGVENHYVTKDELDKFLQEHPDYKKGCTQKRKHKEEVSTND